jgi:hypothetical protein
MKKLLLKILLLAPLLCFGQLSNQHIVLLPMSAQTSLMVNSSTCENPGFLGGHIIINVSSYTSGTYTPHIQGFDGTSGQWYDILIGTGMSGIGYTVLKVYPNISPLTNGAANDILPIKWRIQLVGTNTPNMVISVSANMEL